MAFEDVKDLKIAPILDVLEFNNLKDEGLWKED